MRDKRTRQQTHPCLGGRVTESRTLLGRQGASHGHLAAGAIYPAGPSMVYLLKPSHQPHPTWASMPGAPSNLAGELPCALSPSLQPLTHSAIDWMSVPPPQFIC